MQIVSRTRTSRHETLRNFRNERPNKIQSLEHAFLNDLSKLSQAITVLAPCMAEALHVPDVAVDIGDNSAATSLISEAAVPKGQDLKPLDDSDVQDTSEEVSSLLPGVKAAAVTSASAKGRHTPWFAWPLLFASLVAVSSAAVVFASIPDVPTFTLAAWRLQLTTCLLSPAAIYQYLQLSTGIQLVWCAV